MARSRNQAAAAERKRVRKVHNARRRARKTVLLVTVAAAVAIAVSATAILTAHQASRQRYDLTAIGQGIPAIVQVHDTDCPVCVELRRNISQIENDLDEQDILLRVADVNTDAGLEFASRFTQHRRVTLLYFDPAGNLVDVQTGLQDPETLLSSFREHALSGRKTTP